MGKQNWKAGNMLYPVPAVMVSCQRPGEKANIVTVAWAGTICSDPAMVSISVRSERYSHDIIQETGEFVVNLVSTELTKACDWCGVRSGKDYDKFKELKLKKFKSDFMDTPAIDESPVNIYCKVKKIEKLGSHDLFIAEVIGVTVDEKYMDEKGRFKPINTGTITETAGITILRDSPPTKIIIRNERRLKNKLDLLWLFCYCDNSLRSEMLQIYYLEV